MKVMTIELGQYFPAVHLLWLFMAVRVLGLSVKVACRGK
jgi:hypothetical protein